MLADLPCRHCLVVLLLVLDSLSAQGQPRGNPRAASVFALRDARVVTEPGKVLRKATVVIRDGLIEAVGAEVKPPADAIIIEAKGLTVYPGFIDGLNHWGIDLALRRPEGGPPAAPDTGSDALI